MEVGHAPGVRVMPAYPFCVVGNPDKFNMNCCKMGGGLSPVVMAVMMESMLMQRLVKSTTKLMEPIQAIDVLALDL